MADNRKTVLITGCSKGGIGHSLALEFLRNGLRVFATARNRETIADLKEAGAEPLSLTVDNEESLQSCYKEVCALTGDRGLDYLVNNAGRNYTYPALDVDMAEVRATFETNLFAVIRICQLFSPLLIKAKGTIVQIGSLAGMMPYVFGSVYNASKAALHEFSDTLRVELAPFGVKVITVVTGGVRSRIARVPRALSKDSLYYPINAEYQNRTIHSQSVAVPNEQYAREVVTKILYGSAPWRWFWPWSRPNRWIWAGGKVTTAWLCNFGWTWYGLTEWVISRMFGVYKLKNALK